MGEGWLNPATFQNILQLWLQFVMAQVVQIRPGVSADSQMTAKLLALALESESYAVPDLPL